jgi:excisionase family DNA binding protein
VGVTSNEHYRAYSRKRRGIEHLKRKKAIQPEYFTIAEAGLYIGRSKDGMTALLKQRLIPIIKIGARVHIARKDLDTFMLSHRQ